jgi:hypothetical protein
MERKQQHGKFGKSRHKSRPRPYNKQQYNTNRLDQAGALSSSARRTTDPVINQPWMPIFPARVVKRLRYNDVVSITTTAGAVGSYVLRANDLFDPDFTGTGHQPMGFDALCLFYNHFCVVRSKLTVAFQNTVACPVHSSVRVDGDSTLITVPSRIIELGGNVMVDLEQKTTAGSTRVAELSVDIGKLQGVAQSSITSDPSLQGSAGASPLECTYFHMQIWNDNGVSGSVYANFILEQEAVFSEPRDDVQS